MYSIHTETVVDVIGDVAVVVIKRERGLPIIYRPLKEKRPVGRPRPIREPVGKRPRGILSTWAWEHMSAKPKYTPQDVDYFREFYAKDFRPQVEANKLEGRKTMTPIICTIIGAIIMGSIAMMTAN